MSHELTDTEREAVRQAYAELLNAIADQDALPQLMGPTGFEPATTRL